MSCLRAAVAKGVVLQETPDDRLIIEVSFDPGTTVQVPLDVEDVENMANTMLAWVSCKIKP